MLKKALLSALAVASLFAANARAQEPAAGGAPARAPWIVACEADMAKHCDAEMKAKGDVRPCLAKHEADLSQQCKDIFLRKYKIVELCKDDIDKLCAGATDGSALRKCFSEKQAELSEKCKSALRKGTKEAAAEKAAAAPEKPADPAKTAKAAKPAKPAKPAK